MQVLTKNSEDGCALQADTNKCKKSLKSVNNQYGTSTMSIKQYNMFILSSAILILFTVYVIVVFIHILNDLIYIFSVHFILSNCICYCHFY